MQHQPTETQIGLLHHTLGLDARRRDAWRNYFVAGPGHSSEADLEMLVEAGLMERRRRPGFLEDGDVVYAATEMGKVIALRMLPPEPTLTSYQRFCQVDDGRTFAEWLGIDVPRREYEYGPGRRLRLVSSRATGDWASTVKEAKASYRTNMMRRKEESRRMASSRV